MTLRNWLFLSPIVAISLVGCSGGTRRDKVAPKVVWQSHPQMAVAALRQVGRQPAAVINLPLQSKSMVGERSRVRLCGTALSQR